jgi:hypothetical protein
VIGFGLRDENRPVEAAPSTAQRDESTFRGLLKDRLRASPMRRSNASSAFAVATTPSSPPLSSAGRTPDRELERAEIRELWEALPEPARARLAAIDPHFVPVAPERR